MDVLATHGVKVDDADFPTPKLVEPHRRIVAVTQVPCREYRQPGFVRDVADAPLIVGLAHLLAEKRALDGSLKRAFVLLEVLVFGQLRPGGGKFTRWEQARGRGGQAQQEPIMGQALGCLVDFPKGVFPFGRAPENAPSGFVAQTRPQDVSKYAGPEVAVFVKVQPVKPEAAHGICVVSAEQAYLAAVHQRQRQFLFVFRFGDRGGELLEVLPCHGFGL